MNYASGVDKKKTVSASNLIYKFIMLRSEFKISQFPDSAELIEQHYGSTAWLSIENTR